MFWKVSFGEYALRCTRECTLLYSMNDLRNAMISMIKENHRKENSG